MTTLKEVLGSKVSVKQSLGIEIEVEFDKEHTIKVPGWTQDVDNSLRNVGYEFKSAKPMLTETIGNSLESILNEINSKNPIITNRSSIHVHVNCIGLTHNLS